MDIKGKTVIITGITGKLTSQIAFHLAAKGANCICIYHKNVEKTWIVHKKLLNITQKVFFLEADLTKHYFVGKIFRKIKDLPGIPAPEILINAAAVFDKKKFGDIREVYIAKTFAVNFSASFAMIQKFAKLVGRRKAKIINITDAIVEKYQPGFVVYSASKAALENATKILAKELASNITVNAVSPGIIHWPKKIDVRPPVNLPADTIANVGKVLQAVDFIIENDAVTGRIITT